MALHRPRVNLVKFSFSVCHVSNALQAISKLRNDIKWNWRIESKVRSSFILRHENTYIYQLFTNGHINVTGLKKVEDAHQALTDIFHVLNLPTPVDDVPYKIDNIQCSGQLNFKTHGLTLRQLCDGIDTVKEQYGIHSVAFEPARFPGAFIKFSCSVPAKIPKGTVLLFRSGKFVIVGLREVEHKNRIHDLLELCTWEVAGRQGHCGK